MSSFSDSDGGINIDDPDEIEKSLEADYNKTFQQSYLNHQQKISTTKQDDVDIDDIGEIENYEKIRQLYPLLLSMKNQEL